LKTLILAKSDAETHRTPKHFVRNVDDTANLISRKLATGRVRPTGGLSERARVLASLSTAGALNPRNYCTATLDAVSFASEDLSKEAEGNDQGHDGSRCKIIASRLDGSSDYWIQLIGC
jgi:hypothetical protein